jgi:hypothetical protein
MYDIAPPSSKYDKESAKLRTLSRQEDSKFNVADRSSDRAKRSTAAAHRIVTTLLGMYLRKNLKSKRSPDNSQSNVWPRRNNTGLLRNPWMTTSVDSSEAFKDDIGHMPSGWIIQIAVAKCFIS